jgi:dihydroorotase-like cyclic amidohydrolase
MLAGVIDMHVHSSPDVVPRRLNDFEVARAAAAAGMAGIVIKSHHCLTADRAALVRHVVPGIEVFGGLVLNSSSCGGLNLDAVHTALALGGRIIWLPTVSALNHQRFLRQHRDSAHVRMLTTSKRAVRVIDSQGRVLTALDRIMDAVAEADAVLATGHLAADESARVCARARELGVTRLVVTHPESELIRMEVATQRDLASMGVMFERCCLTAMESGTINDTVEAIRSLGVQSTVLASDLGQTFNPSPADGLGWFRDSLFEAGFAYEDWMQMAIVNPRKLLGPSNATT